MLASKKISAYLHAGAAILFGFGSFLMSIAVEAYLSTSHVYAVAIGVVSTVVFGIAAFAFVHSSNQIVLDMQRIDEYVGEHKSEVTQLISLIEKFLEAQNPPAVKP